jgi:hypothetical protein
MKQTNFYEDMIATDDLSHLMKGKSYEMLPRDWLVVVSDVKQSTKALEKGNYQGVNFIAASVLMAVFNIAKPNQLPFMFGGDGSSVCIPSDLKIAVSKALANIRSLAKKEFGLELRVAIIPYSIIEESSHEILVGKHKVSDDYCQAFFMGDGLNFAETLLKKDVEKHLYDIDKFTDYSECDLSGLECRWNAVPSPHGETLAILIKVIVDDFDLRNDLYDQIINKIHNVYGEKDLHHPLNTQGLNLSYNLKKLSFEAKARTNGKGFFDKLKYYAQMYFENLLGSYLMSKDSKLANINWGQYKDDLIANSHFFGFNDMVNMVCSGTKDQRDILTKYLDKLLADKKIIYGIHVADAALVTCLIFEREKNHIHFVDADLGGYANACKQLKKQASDLDLNIF